MARSDQRVATALQALVTLDELADQPASSIVRDAAVQRFEYTFEATWKAAQAVLLERYGIELASPKPVVRASLENGLITEEEARIGLAMVDHRNLTAHTYNDELANEIFAQIPNYRRLLREWLKRLAKA